MRRCDLQQHTKPTKIGIHLVMTLLAFMLWSHLVTAADAERTGVVITHDGVLNIRSGAGANFPMVGKATKNSTLVVKDATGEWYRVHLPDGTEGYASETYIRLLPTSIAVANQEPEISKFVGVVTDPESLVYAETTDEIIYRPILHEMLFILDEVRQHVHSDGRTMMFRTDGDARILTPTGEIGRIALKALSIAESGWLCGRLKKAGSAEKDFFQVHQVNVINDGEKRRIQYLIGKNTYDTQDTHWVNSDEVDLFWYHILIAAGRKILEPSANHLYRVREQGETYTPAAATDHPEYSQAERIFQQVLAHDAHRPYYLHGDECEYYEGYAGDGIPAGIIALDALADIAVYRGQYRQAIEYLKQIAQHFPDASAGITIPGQWSIGGLAAGVAALKSADIYAAYLHDLPAAIAQLQEIIKTYPQAEVGGFEWNSTLDLIALSHLAELGEEQKIPTDRMVKHFQTVIDNAGSGVVKVQAAIHQATLLRKARHFTVAIEVLSQAIQANPTIPMSFYTTYIDFSVNALDLIVQIMVQDLDDVARAITFCQQIYQQQTAQNLAGAALLLIAEILDDTTATREEVIRAYDLALNAKSSESEPNNLFEQVEIYRTENQPVWGYWTAKERANSIREFAQYRAFVSGDQIPLYDRANTAARVVTHLKQASGLTVFYPDNWWKREWYKVMTDTGIVGWLPAQEFGQNGRVQASPQTSTPQVATPSAAESINPINTSVVTEMENMVLEPILADLRDKDWKVREEAVAALGRLMPSLSIEPLMSALQDSHIEVRLAAISALGKTGDVQAIERLLEMLHDPLPKIRYAVTSTLETVDNDRGLARLLEMLHDPLPEVRQAVISILAKIGGDQITDQMIAMLHDPDPAVRVLVINMLGKFQEPRTMNALLEALNDPDITVRSQAISKLGTSQASSLKKSLLEALQSTERHAIEAQEAPLLNQFITSGYFALAQFLIQEGADVNISGSDGKTPLMLASEQGQAELVSVLIQAGADPTFVNKDGKRAADLARAKQYQEIMDMLERAAAQWQESGRKQE
jgi:tetratricopeptide (TPR) repeat protein/uncharacterized protein YraI